MANPTLQNDILECSSTLFPLYISKLNEPLRNFLAAFLQLTVILGSMSHTYP